MMKKEGFFEKKKRFHLFKSLLYHNGKAQNMPVVAGRLVILHLVVDNAEKPNCACGIDFFSYSDQFSCAKTHFDSFYTIFTDNCLSKIKR